MSLGGLGGPFWWSERSLGCPWDVSVVHFGVSGRYLGCLWEVSVVHFGVSGRYLGCLWEVAVVHFGGRIASINRFSSYLIPI